MNELELIRQMYLWLGINLCNKSVKILSGKILQVFRNLFFPICLHGTAILLQVIITVDMKENNAYNTFLNTFLNFLPCALWWSIFNRRNSIRALMKFVFQAKERHKQLKNSFIFFIGATIYWSAFMISSFMTPVVQCSLIYFNNNATLAIGKNSLWCHCRNFLKDIILHLQLQLMPFLFAILYFSICINIIKIFDDYLKTLVKLSGDCDGQFLDAFLKEYVDIVKHAESVAKIFSLPLLWFVLHVLCMISFLFLDALAFKDKNYLDINGVIEAISFVLLIAVLSLCADEIPVRVHTFKEILYDLKTDRLFKKHLDLNDIIDIVLNRETLSTTVFRMIPFDRCFLLKSIAVIVAHSVIYYQMTE